MENKKIHHLILLVFTIFGLINYFLIKNNIIADNLKLLFFCFFMILILGVSHGALDHFKSKGFFFNIASFLKGSLIITLSFQYSYETTVVFFEYLMVPQIEFEKLIEFNSLLFSTNLIFLIMSLVYLFRKQINKLVLILFEIIFILLSFIYLPLILAFSMYFWRSNIS